MHQDFSDVQSTEYFSELIKSRAAVIVQNISVFAQTVSEITTRHTNEQKETRAYISEFIRPRGMEVNAGDIIAKETEQIIA